MPQGIGNKSEYNFPQLVEYLKLRFIKTIKSSRDRIIKSRREIRHIEKYRAEMKLPITQIKNHSARSNSKKPSGQISD